MPKPILDSARIVARVGQRVAAAVAQHVSMYGEGEAGALAYALDQPIDRVGRERPAALGREDEAAIGELPAQFAQCPDFVAAKRVNATACHS